VRICGQRECLQSCACAPSLSLGALLPVCRAMSLRLGFCLCSWFRLLLTRHPLARGRARAHVCSLMISSVRVVQPGATVKRSVSTLSFSLCSSRGHAAGPCMGVAGWRCVAFAQRGLAKWKLASQADR
jgi:hypothetical protein